MTNGRNRYLMGWSQAQDAWIVVYADSESEAVEKYEAGEYTHEPD